MTVYFDSKSIPEKLTQTTPSPITTHKLHRRFQQLVLTLVDYSRCGSKTGGRNGGSRRGSSSSRTPGGYVASASPRHRFSLVSIQGQYFKLFLFHFLIRLKYIALCQETVSKILNNKLRKASSFWSLVKYARAELLVQINNY
jgi:hypothetical protein